MAEISDIAFVSPAGSDPDELRHAFDETDRRIKRAFLVADQATVTVNRVAESVSQEFATLSADLEAFRVSLNEEFDQLSQSISSLIAAAFTTNQEPGFASIPQQTTGLTTDRCIAVRDGTPRSLTSGVFRKEVLSLDTPKAHTVNTQINTGFSYWADSSTYVDNNGVNAVKSDIYNVAVRVDYLIQLVRDDYLSLVTKLKQSGVLS
jgi:hypothetical protein